MKRLIAVLSGLLVLPAFAEVAPIYYDAIEYSDTELDADADDAIVEEEVVEQSVTKQAASAPVNGRSATGRSASRAVPATAAKSVAPTRAVTSRGTTTRNATAARTATNTASRASTARATVSRAATPASVSTATGKTVTARRATTQSGNAGVARAATNSSIVQTDTVNQPLYTARVGIRTSGITSRVPTVRMTGATETATETVSKTDAASEMDELAQMTDFCKAQYTQCMDNFCNVLDDNQGRCSCSANLKNYAATEAALEKATDELQEVAQKIQYIGLTGDEIETLFTQTEAELKMSSTSDSTQLKNDLDRIKNLIVDVKSGTATTTDTGMSLDLSGLLDFTISSTGFDLSSLFGTSSNTNSISNQRGEQLYKTAAARCKASVLNSCQAQGVDISLITNSYDLEIDKQCIQYERSLTDTNSQMVSTVRNAKSVLQKARLMVAQQKNAYDLRGCINALDSCMQDEFVCGSDYENCLDPTGKWIVSGEVVTGGTPGVSGGNYSGNQAVTNTLYSVWDYTVNSDKKNAWYNEGSVLEYVGTLTNTQPASNSKDMMTYLRGKIGYIDKDGKTYGMCASVLNKCQDITFSGSGNNKTFKYDNDVIKEYLTRTMTQIKTQQDKVLADYADSCISDVASCLSQNNYNYSGTTTLSNGANYSDIAINACAAVINTCKSATTPDNNALSVKVWLNQALNSGYPITQEVCEGSTSARTGATWSDGVCTIKSGALTFKFSTASNAWVATDATAADCANVANSTFDSVLGQCTTATTPSATQMTLSGLTFNKDSTGRFTASTSDGATCTLAGGTLDSGTCTIKTVTGLSRLN